MCTDRYNASIGVGIARPPLVADSIVDSYNTKNPTMTGVIKWVRSVISLPTGSDLGQPAADRYGMLKMPTLMVCGKNDPYLLCSSPAASKTVDFVVPGKYTYFEAACGHNLLTAKASDANYCKTQADVDSVFKAITDHIHHVVADPASLCGPGTSFKAASGQSGQCEADYSKLQQACDAGVISCQNVADAVGSCPAASAAAAAVAAAGGNSGGDAASGPPSGSPLSDPSDPSDRRRRRMKTNAKRALPILG